MLSITEPTSAEQLATMPNDGKRYELVNGELRMMSPAGFEHGRLVMRLASRLTTQIDFSRENPLNILRNFTIYGKYRV